MKRLALVLLLAGCTTAPQDPGAASYRDEVLRDQPIAYFEFTDGARPGTAKGGVTFEPGPIGAAARFDGQSGRIQAPGTGLRSIATGPFTIELWFKADRASRGDLINYKAEGGYNDLGVFSCYDAQDQVGHYEGQALRASSENVPVAAWHHLVVVRAPDKRITLWIDGRERDAGEGEMSWDFEADFIIGCNHAEGDFDQITLPFAGLIDEVAVYRSALSRERVEAHFRAGGGVPTPQKPEPRRSAGARPPAADDASFTALKLADFASVLEGAGDPGRTFREADGVIICTGRPAGYLASRKSYRNFTLRYDWRFKRPVTLEDDSMFAGNSGCLLFIGAPRVLYNWPKSIEVQGLNRDAGQILPIPRSLKCKYDEFPKERRLKPIGEWNTMEIAVREGAATVVLNGAKVASFRDCELLEGPIGFQSEGAEIHWTNIRIREE
jgi:hypothetical protein